MKVVVVRHVVVALLSVPSPSFSFVVRSLVRRSVSPRQGVDSLFIKSDYEEDVKTDDAAAEESHKLSRTPDDQDDDPNFLDAFLEVPDVRLLSGDVLSLLIVNFLLQIADDVTTSEFWAQGGFLQPVTFPTTLLAVVVRDSKMTISWVLSGLWNRAYSSSTVYNDKIAAKEAFSVWVDYFSIRCLFELGISLLFSHMAIDLWALFREAWYMLLILISYRIIYSRLT